MSLRRMVHPGAATLCVALITLAAEPVWLRASAQDPSGSAPAKTGQTKIVPIVGIRFAYHVGFVYAHLRKDNACRSECHGHAMIVVCADNSCGMRFASFTIPYQDGIVFVAQNIT